MKVGAGIRKNEERMRMKGLLFFLCYLSGNVVARRFLGSEGSAIMINGQNMVMLGYWESLLP